MRPTRLILVLAGALCCLAAPAADLAKIERAPPKVPGTIPRYCLLVFGPEAKTRVWLVVHGDTLYVDRNGNGDLGEPGKAVRLAGGWTNAGDVRDNDGKTTHTRLRVSRHGERMRLTVLVAGKQQHLVGFDEDDPLHFAPTPQDAPVVHLGGPLTVRLYGQPPAFVAGRATELDICVGTPGLGKGTFAALQCCNILNCKTAPVGEIDFPPQDPAREPIRVHVSLGDD